MQKSSSCGFALIILFLASVVTQTISQAEQTAYPYLIVPGFSIGKVQLGQSQEDVRHKMGQPTKSESRRCGTITPGRSPGLNRKIVGWLDADTWLRPVSPKDEKRIPQNGCPNFFKVLYQDGKVIQVTIALDGYKTKENLSIKSIFTEFAKRYGKADEILFELDSERPFGSSHVMQSYWDFKKYGLAIESNIYGDEDAPKTVFALSIHQPDRSYLFNSIHP